MNVVGLERREGRARGVDGLQGIEEEVEVERGEEAAVLEGADGRNGEGGLPGEVLVDQGEELAGLRERLAHGGAAIVVDVAGVIVRQVGPANGRVRGELAYRPGRDEAVRGNAGVRKTQRGQEWKKKEEREQHENG